MSNTNEKKPGSHAYQPAMRALKNLKHSRWYAVSEAQQLSLGAIIQAFTEKHGFNHILDSDAEWLIEKLSKLDFLPLRQARAQEPEKIVWPIDEVTGERLPNPWESGGNLGERNVVHKISPALAKYFERAASEGRWKLYAESLEQSAARAITNAIAYGEREHKANPFRRDDRAAQAEFVKSNPPEKVNFYRQEAEDVTFPWSPATINRTHLGFIVKADTELGELAIRAGEIETRWLEEKRQMALEEEKTAREKLEALQGQLGGARTVGPTRAELAKAAAAR